MLYVNTKDKGEKNKSHNTDPHIRHNAKHEVWPVNPLFRGVLAIDGELRLSVVSENIWFLPAAYFSVLCVLRLSGLLHAHMENLTSESLPHSAIVFLPSNVGRQ